MKARDSGRRTGLRALSAAAVIAALGTVGVTTGSVASSASIRPATTATHLVAMPYATSVPKAVGIPKHGNFDCNGYSSAHETVEHAYACTDIRGFLGVDNANTWGGKFYDNGRYIGHDEPDLTFLSTKAGSGDNVTWNETLPADPSATPGTTSPGHDVSHWFELSPAPWFSMMMCDPYSYPQLACTPQSDSNAPSCPQAFQCPANAFPGGGSAVMEMQFYPPGNQPWVDNESCSATQWCAAITIDSLECTNLYATCQTACEEPINFAWIQKNGVPTGPAGPGNSTLATSIPNSETLRMSAGDHITVHMFDAPAASALGGNEAFKVVIDDLTQGTTGFMQASAANGFQFVDMNCGAGVANFQPEYSTASRGNISPWAALQTNISTEFETGHFEPCTSVSGVVANPIDSKDIGGTYTNCAGSYEGGGSEGPETSDEICYAANDPHTGYDGPTTSAAGAPIANCQANWQQNGDLDFDGSPYRTEWPTGASATTTNPGSFVQSLPTTGGSQYSQFYLQTDVELSESACGISSTQFCDVPPAGPEVSQAGNTSFYPYWSEVNSGSTCTWEFGNVGSGTGVNTFGKDAQYGTTQFAQLGFPEAIGPIYDNTCTPTVSQGFYEAGSAGQVVSAGDAPNVGNVHGLQGKVVGISATPDGKGYFAVSDTGAVYAGGDAVFQGDLTTLGIHVSNIVSIAATSDGGGYYVIGSDGGMFTFGDAKFHGSIPGIPLHVSNIVAMVSTPSNTGYLIVGADGGVFTFGRVKFYGSLPGQGTKVNDIRGILPAAAGTGYILVGADGGAFVFGHGTPFHGSLPLEHITVSDIVGIALTSDDNGYWMAGANGVVFPFGDARTLSSNFTAADTPLVGIAGATTDNVEP